MIGIGFHAVDHKMRQEVTGSYRKCVPTTTRTKIYNYIGKFKYLLNHIQINHLFLHTER